MYFGSSYPAIKYHSSASQQNLDPILLFSQILILMALLGIGWENIRLRGLLIANNTNQKIKR